MSDALNFTHGPGCDLLVITKGGANVESHSLQSLISSCTHFYQPSPQLLILSDRCQLDTYFDLKKG
jgi:hypothetical protein